MEPPAKQAVFYYPTLAGWGLAFGHVMVSFGLLWAWMALPASVVRVPVYPLSMLAFSLCWLGGCLILRKPQWSFQRLERGFLAEITQWIYVAVLLLACAVSRFSWFSPVGIPSLLCFGFGLYLLPRHLFFSRKQEIELPPVRV